MRGDTLEFRDRIPFRHDRTSAGSFHMAHDDEAGMIVLRTTYPRCWHHMSP